jgi:hypothetical protein
MTVSDQWTGMSMQGLWLNKFLGAKDIANNTDELPFNDQNVTAGLQAFMGKYFFNSFLQTYADSNPGWGINITEHDLYPSTVIVMDTNHLNLYLPGLRDHYEPIALANQTYMDLYKTT